MHKELEKKLQKFEFDGATDEDVDAICEYFGQELPKDLRATLVASDGISLKSKRHLLQIWSCQEIIDFNRANGVQKYMPEFLMFGSDGGGESFALDYRKKPPAVVLLPAIGADYASAIPVADDFGKLLIRLQRVRLLCND